MANVEQTGQNLALDKHYSFFAPMSEIRFNTSTPGANLMKLLKA
jgi:hypothetical protein